jgi:nucleoside-diphosphate kinase
MRKLIGETMPEGAFPGTIRGDFSNSMESGNLIHASDTKQNAIIELNRFFDF